MSYIYIGIPLGIKMNCATRLLCVSHNSMRPHTLSLFPNTKRPPAVGIYARTLVFRPQGQIKGTVVTFAVFAGVKHVTVRYVYAKSQLASSWMRYNFQTGRR